MIMIYVEPGDGRRYRVVAQPLDVYSEYARKNGMTDSADGRAKVAEWKPTFFAFGEGDYAMTSNCFMGEPDFSYAAEKLNINPVAMPRPATRMMAYLCLRAVLDLPLIEPYLEMVIRDESLKRLTDGWDEKLRQLVREHRERAYMGYAPDMPAAHGGEGADGYYRSFAEAYRAWELGKGCREGIEGNHCSCVYYFPCPGKCGANIRATGDSMPSRKMHGGICTDCYMEQEVH